MRPRPPARGGGAGRRPGLRRLTCANAQQKHGHARSFRRARQTQGCGEVERARRAENFDQCSAKTFAARRFDPGAQNRLGVLAAHQRQRGGIDAELGKSHAVEPPALALQNVLPHPEHGPPRRCAQGEPQAEPGGGGSVGAPRSMNLMQAGAAQAASQKSVDVFRAEGKVLGAVRRHRAFATSLGEEPSQCRQGFYARRRASLRFNPVHGVFSFMFMICSI